MVSKKNDSRFGQESVQESALNAMKSDSNRLTHEPRARSRLPCKSLTDSLKRTGFKESFVRQSDIAARSVFVVARRKL